MVLNSELYLVLPRRSGNSCLSDIQNSVNNSMLLVAENSRCNAEWEAEVASTTT